MRKHDTHIHLLKAMLLLMVSLCGLLCSGQSIHENALQQFVRTGYRIIETYNGQLNNDTLSDMLLLLGLDSATYAMQYPDSLNGDFVWKPIGERPLVILIRKRDGSLYEFARNNEAVVDEWATNYGGDALSSISIDTGKFSIYYFYHGGGTHVSRTITFKYNVRLNDWLFDSLIDSVTSDQADEEGNYDNTETVYKTVKGFGRITFKEYSTDMLMTK